MCSVLYASFLCFNMLNLRFCTFLKTNCGLEALESAEFYGIYFAAQWCDDCEVSHPHLLRFYNTINGSDSEGKEEGEQDTPPSSPSFEKKIEFVFVSSDESEEDWLRYFNEEHGDWLSIPYNNPLRQELKRRFETCAGKEMEEVGLTRREVCRDRISCLSS